MARSRRVDSLSSFTPSYLQSLGGTQQRVVARRVVGRCYGMSSLCLAFFGQILGVQRSTPCCTSATYFELSGVAA